MNRVVSKLLLAAAFAAFSGSAGAQEIHWHTDYKAMIEEARQTGKPIFLSFR